MFKAIIFDVDGTLSETEDIHRKAFNRSFKLKDLPWYWDRQAYRRLLLISGGKERIRHFVERYDPAGSQVEDFDGFIRDIHKTKTEIYTQMITNGVAELRPGIRQLITKAIEDDIRLAIATTTSAPNITALLQSAYGSDGPGIFEVVCAGDDVRRKKPAPDIYLLTLERLNLAAEDCVAIEDSRNGLLSSTGAGIPTVVTPSIYTDDQSFDEAAIVTDELGNVDFATVFADTRNETTEERASRRRTA